VVKKNLLCIKGEILLYWKCRTSINYVLHFSSCFELSIEVFELFKPEQTIHDDVNSAVAKHLDDVDDALIKSIEEAVRPAVKKSLVKMRRYYAKGTKK